jgi:hypothetical protein
MGADPNTHRIAYAKERAGYAEVDTPSEPRRSAYTDDSIGEGAYRHAVEKWELFLSIVGA